MTRKNRLIPLSLLALLLCSCTPRQLVINQVGGVVVNGMPAFYQEEDYKLAGEALPANIKFLESLLQSGPKNTDLLLATSQAVFAYAFGYVETDFERNRFKNPEAREASRKRAQELYLRAKAYAERALVIQAPKLAEAMKGSPQDFHAALEKTSNKNLVPTLFWLGFSWGGYINLTKDSITAVAGLPYVRDLMDKVIALDESYFNGSAHAFSAVIYGGQSKMFGGDPAKAREHFEKVEKITKGRLLLGKVLRAQYLSTQELDRKGFDQLIEEVLSAPDNLYPEQRLLNEIAKVRAGILKSQAKELF